MQRTTWKAIYKQIPNAVVPAVALIGVIAKLLWKVDETFLVGLVATMITAMAFKDIWKEIISAEERAGVEILEKKMERLETCITSTTSLQHVPLDKSLYAGLFGNFTGLYYAYNPAFDLEQGANFDKDQLIKTVFIPRYTGGNCEAHYLFFTADQTGKDNLENFKALMRLACKQCKAIEKHVFIKSLESKPAAPELEIYFGTQLGKPTVVMELGEPGRTHGRPNAYCVIREKAVHDRIFKQFDCDWKNKTCVSHKISEGADATAPKMESGANDKKTVSVSGDTGTMQ